MTGHALPYEALGGDLHRHGDGPPHAHPHTGPHSHEADHRDRHAHSHGLIDRSIMRSREGLQAVGISFAVLGLAAWLREPYKQSLYAQHLDRESRRVAVEVRGVANQEAQLNR